MPKKVKTRRQRKRATVTENVAKEEHKTHPGEESCNLGSRVIIDENLAKHITRPPLVSPSKEEEEQLALTSSDELEKKKAGHKRGRTPKETRISGQLGKALDKDEEDKLFDQIWKELDVVFPTTDEDITKDGLSPNVDWSNLKSSYKLEKNKAAYQRSLPSRGTGNAWKLGTGVNRDKKQYSPSDFKADLDKILKDLDELLPPIDKAEAKRRLSPVVELEKHSGNLESSDIIDRNRPTFVSPSGEEKNKAIKSHENLDKDEEQYSTSNSLSIIDEAELDQIWKDLHEIFPSSAEAVAKDGLSPEVEGKKKSGNLESSIIIDSNPANRPPLVSPSEEEKNEAITSTDKLIKKKAAHHRNESSKGTGNPIHFQEHASSEGLGTINNTELDQIWKDMHEIYPHSAETVANVGLYPNKDCSTPGGPVGDSGTVPPKFFGNSGYFMLTGTNSQLQQQMKNLAARNIIVESFVELPDAMADIVERQMADLVENPDPILRKLRQDYDILEPRRVPRQKKQRKYPKKTDK